MSFCINPLCQQPENSDNVLFCFGCGSELLLQGRYRVVSQLGGGGFGKTYEVSDRSGESKVLKVLHNNHPKAVELFQREAEVLSVLDHPGIPKVESDGYFVYHPKNSQQPVHCLVMEKIHGLDLQKYLTQRGNQPIDQKLAIAWLTELATILQQVHSQNFFHRDIKPANIMLRADGGLVLIDFGTVRQITETYMAKQADGNVTGIVSSGYTPPEQMNGQAVQQSDFFALGRTFVYLLTATNPSQLYNPLTDELLWRDNASGVSPIFADFLDCMMARLPGQRPEHTRIILQRLTEINQALYPPSQLKNKTNQSVNNQTVSDVQINQSFFKQWILAIVIGITVGIFARSLTSVIMNTSLGSNIRIFYPLLAAIATITPVEIMQDLVLRRLVSWNLRSIFGTIFSILVGAIIGAVLLGSINYLIAPLIGSILGSFIAKWFILQKLIHRSSRAKIAVILIILVSLVASGVVSLIIYIILALRPSLRFPVSVATFITMFEIITGRILVWLLQRPV
jgi:serine/threonine protein kinase